MFEGDSADTCAGKFPLVSMGGRAKGLACADPGARTPIDACGHFCLGWDWFGNVWNRFEKFRKGLERFGIGLG